MGERSLKAYAWRVSADHCILLRPDKGGLTFSEAVAYAKELRRLSFENVEIYNDILKLQIGNL